MLRIKMKEALPNIEGEKYSLRVIFPIAHRIAATEVSR